MKNLKTILSVLIAAMLLLAFAGCSDNKNEKPSETAAETHKDTAEPETAPSGTDAGESDRTAAGTYTGVYAKFVGDETKVTDEEFSLILLEDGTGEHFREGTSYKVTWEQNGEDIEMTETFMGITIEYNGTIKDGELILFNGDKDDDLTYQYVYKLDA